MQGNVWLILLFAALLLILVVYLWLTQPIDEPITRPKTPPPRQTPDEPIEPPPPALLHSLTPEPITAAFELPTSQPTGRGRLPPSAPLDPADPLVQQYDAAVEKLRSTLAAIDGVPVHLHDLVAMRVECMAIADVLDSVRRTLQATDSGALGAPRASDSG